VGIFSMGDFYWGNFFRGVNWGFLLVDFYPMSSGTFNLQNDPILP
jgi:hypothetical protein